MLKKQSQTVIDETLIIIETDVWQKIDFPLVMQTRLPVIGLAMHKAAFVNFWSLTV